MEQDTIHQLYLTPPGKKLKLYPHRKFYYYYGGRIGSAEGDFIGRALHGEYTCFTREKILSLKGHYVYGLKNGIWKEWYSSGTLRKTQGWKKGTKNGNYFSYYTNGIISEQGRYKKNLKNGHWTKFYGNGLVAYQASYRKGQLNGKFLEFYPDGKLKLETKYKNGLLHGSYLMYDKQGKVVEELLYSKGELVIPKEVLPSEMESKESATVSKKERQHQPTKDSQEEKVKGSSKGQDLLSPKVEVIKQDTLKESGFKRWWPFRKKTSDNENLTQ